MSEIKTIPKMICWDLDLTLGQFAGLEYLAENIPKTEVPRAYRSITKRFNIDPVLERLTGQGFSHYLTTSATEDYAREALQRSLLVQHFGDFIWDRTVSKDALNMGKLYGDLEESFFEDDEDYPDNMIAVGDSINDQPAIYDLKKLVFLHQEEGYLYDATVVESIINRLLREGFGSFYKGFQNLHDNSPQILRAGWNYIDDILVRNVSISPDISVDLAFVNLFKPEFNVGSQMPVISNIIAPLYRRDPEVVEKLYSD